MLERPAARFTFVVGKGGVGKSTTAAGLALAWADAGHPIHLISTDPAHSLGDVLGLALEPGRTTRRCSDALVVEEFDADGRARQWLAEVRAPVTALFEQGSYLDAEDVARFSALRLPGMDEVMAAQRLLELAEGPAPTIVVDTAPTGHTLRLLDAAAVLRSWTDLLDALAGKGAAVATALIGAAPEGPGPALCRRLHAQLAGFDARVLRDAACVLVTRAGGPVVAETDRLAVALSERALPIQARVHVGPGAARSDVFVPWLDPPPRGCRALRAWRTSLRTAPCPAAAVTAPGRTRAGGAWLLERAPRLLLFAGKGGVGKSTCAAATALLLAGQRSVLLLGADPAGSLADVLGVSVEGEPATVAPGLRAVQVDATAALEAWRADFRAQGDALLGRFGLGGDPRLDRRVVEAMWNVAPPGMDELVALATLMDAAADQETVVLDGAPTGHMLRLLALPEIALEWTHAAMRTLLKYGVAGELDALAARLLAFARQLKGFRSRLVDPGRTGAVVVTLSEPVVRAETDRLIAALARLGIPLTATIHNRAAPHDGPVAAGTARRLRAPSWPEPPRGIAALREFVSRWELD